mmetsp:Transcript_40645/g.65337  ORF Transcript_40645/g.65337 Transcript_40645/m.65337 type:complete len:118 (-) Transcript_40645:528-881(-)
MVNAAGRFGDMDADVTGEQKPASPSSSSSPSMTTTEEKEGSGGVLESIQETFKDIIAAGIFYSTRFRIPLILKNGNIVPFDHHGDHHDLLPIVIIVRTEDDDDDDVLMLMFGAGSLS